MQNIDYHLIIPPLTENFVVFPKMESHQYLDLLKKKDRDPFDQFTFLTYGTETSFERKRISDVCKHFNIPLENLNSFIEGYDLKLTDRVADLFPKTKLQLHLFILSRSGDPVIVPLIGLSPHTRDEWKALWIKNYSDKRVIAIDIVDHPMEEKFVLKVEQ